MESIWLSFAAKCIIQEAAFFEEKHNSNRSMEKLSTCVLAFVITKVCFELLHSEAADSLLLLGTHDVVKTVSFSLLFSFQA